MSLFRTAWGCLYCRLQVHLAGLLRFACIFWPARKLGVEYVIRKGSSLLTSSVSQPGTGSGNAPQHLAGDDANAGDGREHCVGPVVSGSWWKSIGLRSVELLIGKSDTSFGRSGALDSG